VVQDKPEAQDEAHAGDEMSKEHDYSDEMFHPGHKNWLLLLPGK
jgi:hypothetical protein